MLKISKLFIGQKVLSDIDINLYLDNNLLNIFKTSISDNLTLLDSEIYEVERTVKGFKIFLKLKFNDLSKQDTTKLLSSKIIVFKHNTNDNYQVIDIDTVNIEIDAISYLFSIEGILR